jgi:peptidoglycan hydrolase CwlO-like protein
MLTTKTKVTQLDIVDVKITQLQEDVVEIRSDISVLKKDVSNIKHQLNNMDDKLDKILDTVSFQQGGLHKRVSILEHHTTHPPTAVAI